MTGEKTKKEADTEAELTARDLRDIKKNVDSFIVLLDNEKTLRYGDIEIELTDENREVLRSAINIIETTLKKENKAKYNPDKNGK